MNYRRWESFSEIVVAVGVAGGAILAAVIAPVYGVVATVVVAAAGLARYFLGKAADRKQEHESSATTMQSVGRAKAVIPLAMPVGAGVHGEIDDAWRYVGLGQPQVTVDLLQKLRKRSWDRLSPREQYRVLANIGNAKLSQQDYSGAARFYLKSVRYQPTDADARALEALAFHLLHKVDKAYSLAVALCAEEPELGRGHMIRIRNAPADLALGDLEDSVPIAIRSHPEVALALHDRAVEHGLLQEAERIARDLPEEDHEWAPLTLALAGTILQQETGKLRIGREGPIVSDPTRLSEAADMLTRAIEKVPAGDPEDLSFAALLNRGTARRLLGHTDLAADDFRKAFDLRPSDSRAVIALARSAYPDKDDVDEAVSILDRYLSENSSIEVELLLAECLWHREDNGDLDRAARVLEQLLPRLSELDQEDQRAEAVAILVDVYTRHDEGDRALSVVENLKQECLEPATKAAIQGELLRKLGRTKEANNQAFAALKELGESSEWSLVVHVALLFERLGLFKEAFGLWSRIVEPGFVSAEANHLLTCARKCGEDKFVMKFCRELRAAGHYDHRSISHEIETLTSYGEFSAARDALLDYLAEKPEDKIARLNLTVLALQHEWFDLIEKDAVNLPTVEELESAFVGAVVSDVLRAGPDPIQAVDYAYDLYRRFSDQSPAHRALIVAVFAPGAAGLHIDKPHEVARGTAVCYREKDSNEKRWLVVEDAEGPSLTRQEYDESHALVQALLGGTVGSEFPLSEGGIRDVTGVILEILDKRIFRANELAERWKERFPDEPGFEAVPLSLSESPSLDDLAEITEAMKRLSEQGVRVENAYRDGRLPIAVVAEINGKSVFESVEFLAGRRDLPVRCCEPDRDSRTKAIASLTASEGVVLEPSAVTTLWLLDPVIPLARLPFSCVLTESALQELRSLARGDLPGHGATGYLAYEGGRLRFQEIDPEQRELRRQKIRDFSDRLEAHCEVVGGSDLASVNATVREQLTRCVPGSSAEAAAAASCRGLVLWTDDHLLHELVKEDLPSHRIWSQAVFIWAREEGLLDTKHMSRITARLLRLGYFFSTSDPVTVLDTCEEALWRPEDPDLSAVLADFGSQSWDLDSAVSMTTGALTRIWKEAPSVEHAQAITASLLAHLSDRPDSRDIVRALLPMVPGLLGLAVLRSDPLQRILRTYVNRGVALL